MKSASVVLAVDQGTTGTRAIFYDHFAVPRSSAYSEFTQYYPKPGWVEHDPNEIWETTCSVVLRAYKELPRTFSALSIGLTNQRETTLLWDRKTGEPVHRAIVWQDRRTSSDCLQLKKRDLEKIFRKKTGLVLDPYFSGTKIAWLLSHIPGLRKKAQRGDILFGTVDTWLLWKLTGGRVHATDLTNASRTLLLNIITREWDPELLDLLQVPKAILPEVKESGHVYGQTSGFKSFPSGIPITAVMGDQQSALYGQGCYRKGEGKNTYGTGCFIVVNNGINFQQPPFGVLATLACDANGKSSYAFEGSVFIAGAAMQWLRDGLHFFENASQTQALAESVKDTGGVTFVPALAGLGSPYWNSDARGMITGLTRGTRREHIVRAALESIAHQTADVLECMTFHRGKKLHELRVDGGATKNNFLMQFQADILGIPVMVSSIPESTAWGAAKLAGHISGLWPSVESLDKKTKYTRFSPRMKPSRAKLLRKAWKKEINRLLNF